MTTPPTGPAFAWRVRVYWEDTDAGGVVFYANYLKFFERARTEWLRSLGMQQAELRQRLGGMFVVTHTAVNYLAPARLDDELLIETQVQHMGAATLHLQQSAALLKSEHDGLAHRALAATGAIHIAWVQAASLQPQRLPVELRQVLAGTSSA
jgi:acyl-CoA thioester hydrolase